MTLQAGNEPSGTVAQGSSDHSATWASSLTWGEAMKEFYPLCLVGMSLLVPQRGRAQILGGQLMPSSCSQARMEKAPGWSWAAFRIWLMLTDFLPFPPWKPWFALFIRGVGTRYQLCQPYSQGRPCLISGRTSKSPGATPTELVDGRVSLNSSYPYKGSFICLGCHLLLSFWNISFVELNFLRTGGQIQFQFNA